MKVNNTHISGIFLWNQSWVSANGIEFENGDIVILNGNLFECHNDDESVSITLGPTQDIAHWKSLTPALSSVDDLINGGDESKIVTNKIVNDALFGDNGIAKFIKPNNSIKQYSGAPLSDIDYTSTHYISNDRNVRRTIPDLPAVTSKYIFEAIVNTIVGDTIVGDTYSTQEYISFNENGEIKVFAARVKSDGTWGNWKTIMLGNDNETYTRFENLAKMFNCLSNYTNENLYKYSDVSVSIQNGTTFGPIYNNTPNYNLLIKVGYSTTTNNITETAIQWINIFSQDILDSIIGKLILFESADLANRVYIRNRIVTCEGTDIHITKVLKYSGDVSEGTDGTTYYRFGSNHQG